MSKKVTTCHRKCRERQRSDALGMSVDSVGFDQNPTSALFCLYPTRIRGECWRCQEQRKPRGRKEENPVTHRSILIDSTMQYYYELVRKPTIPEQFRFVNCREHSSLRKWLRQFANTTRTAGSVGFRLKDELFPADCVRPPFNMEAKTIEF